MKKQVTFFIAFIVFLSCANTSVDTPVVKEALLLKVADNQVAIPFDGATKTIHILVALCDNTYQGIVRVPKKIGNGQDPRNNLYWGTAYGVKTYFKRSKEWVYLESTQPSSIILERVVFKHRTENYYLVADAYDGQYIKNTTEKFIKSTYGVDKDTINVNGVTLGIEGNANLVAYIGHDGLMDFEITERFEKTDTQSRDVILLACYSKRYFEPHLKEAGVNPLVWSTGLMAPEAYTIHDAISGYILNESNEKIRSRAAKAYAKYQKCSVKSARRLLVHD